MAHAVRRVGGIEIHNSVPYEQQQALAGDLQYLYLNPVRTPDRGFLAVTGMRGGSGPAMHHWLLRRVSTIVGESFNATRATEIHPRPGRFSFPDSILPSWYTDPQITPFSANTPSTSPRRLLFFMSNLSGPLYLEGKRDGVLRGHRLGPRRVVWADSPRAGVIKVGAALFHRDFRPTKARLRSRANSIQRLTTLFHEARHSDGNGATAVFLHTLCPRGHAYEGSHVCDASSNGPYSVGALTARHLLSDCTTCSVTEQTVLQVRIADNFNRAAPGPSVQLRRDRALLTNYQNQVQNLRGLLTTAPEPQRPAIMREIEGWDSRITELDTRLDAAQELPTIAPMTWDDRPEGRVRPVTRYRARELMDSSNVNPRL